MGFSQVIINWYRKNGRELPWRDTRDPYLVWLSEIILQQTRVSQGMPYYERFSAAFPNVSSLARAGSRQVLRLWQGLGYYSRARNMHRAARLVMRKYNGKFPTSYTALLTLPGTGDYTASAVSSICGAEAHAVLDGNVIRVLSRYYALRSPVDKSSTRKKLKELAGRLLDEKNPGEFNQAMMDLGAMVCTPANPNCSECPLQSSCLGHARGIAARLPMKSKKKTPLSVYYHYYFPFDKPFLFLRHRKGRGIWRGLYDLPCIENATELDPAAFCRRMEKENGRYKKPVMREFSASFRHVLSHRIIHARFYGISFDRKFFSGKDLVKVPLGKITRYPVPRLIEKFMEGIRA